MMGSLSRFLAGTALLALAAGGASAQGIRDSGGAGTAPCSVGFRLAEFQDSSRMYCRPAPSSGQGTEMGYRPIRMYVWYPTEPSAASGLPLEAFARMATEDFEGQPVNGPRRLSLPVPLARGFSPSGLEAALRKPTSSVRDAKPLRDPRPLVLIATGLYYESPLTFLSLSEFLAGHGYVVVACPLRGTHDRLVRLTVPDLETLVRDLEIVMAEAMRRPDVDVRRIGVIGYDMGGMAAIVLAMRNPAIRAFVSYDCSIVTPHYSGLPVSHPSYDARRLVVPWIHLSQSRFVEKLVGSADPPTIIQKKEFGDNYLVGVNTTNHGAFTTYADLGIENPVPGYWGTVEQNLKSVSLAVSECSLLFLDGYLKGDASARSRLQGLALDNRYPEAFRSFEFAAGRQAPPSQDEWIDRIIRAGMSAALPDLETYRAEYPAERLIDEGALNWLGYHFLYWWGRQEEAVGVFEWMTRVFPTSGNAFDSLGEAYLVAGRREEAAESYRRSLELDPNNANAKAALERIVGE